MDEKFRQLTDNLHSKFEALMGVDPVTNGILPATFKGAGVYLFSENGKGLYVGRTRNVRQRYGQHTKPTKEHNRATFAFKLARQKTGFIKSAHAPGEMSRVGLLGKPEFAEAFREALERVRRMEFRFVEEGDPTRQCLLEVYVSVVCESPNNDFNTT